MYFLLLSYRCGDDLIALYHSKGVQCYLGGTSVQHDKPIHQPGIHYERSVYIYVSKSAPALTVLSFYRFRVGVYCVERSGPG